MLSIQPVNEMTMDPFFKEHQQEKWAEEFGYYITLQEEVIGFFVLYPLEEGAWLRRLLMKEQKNPALIVMAFDWVAEEAKQLGYMKLLTAITDPEKRLLLEMNNFKPGTEPSEADAPEAIQWYERQLQ
ncbi:hypothetical protein [Halalkalibacillus halophilus]|uniref:hypothetical protein n=1 Tax=Halalkalibacillus halophilus TaxID=392827 RepID=UPI0004160765|nr:hypothetical protein [Halalkalibacillus halophilus]